MSESREHKVIFGLSDADTDGIRTLVLLMPEGAWDYMTHSPGDPRGGLCHEFELTNIGVPLRMVIGRTATYATGRAAMERLAGAKTDVSHLDMHIGAKKPQQ